MNYAVLLTALAFAADPFWVAKPPAQWSDPELVQFLTDSPWAKMAEGPGKPAPAPVRVYLATAAPMLQAEEERERRAMAKRRAAKGPEPDELAEEYRLWIEDNRPSQIILAIQIPDQKSFSDQKEVRQMEKECVMLVGKKKIQMTGHFPPSPTDPYLRLAFPRRAQGTDKVVGFDLYLPGVTVPFRHVEFVLKDLLVNGRLEL
jgi:hypothetical protein